MTRTSLEMAIVSRYASAYVYICVLIHACHMTVSYVPSAVTVLGGKLLLLSIHQDGHW